MRDVLKNGAARFLLGIMVKHQSHYMRHTKPFWATDCYHIKVDTLDGFQDCIICSNFNTSMSTVLSQKNEKEASGSKSKILDKKSYT